MAQATCGARLSFGTVVVSALQGSSSKMSCCMDAWMGRRSPEGFYLMAIPQENKPREAWRELGRRGAMFGVWEGVWLLGWLEAAV